MSGVEGISGAELGPPRHNDGEPCEQCGSPLAADQRYCLNCGQRRGAPRVEYRRQVQAAQAPGAPAATTAAAAPEGEAKPAEKRERDYAPLAAVGGIAVLGLMLLIGVLIGKGDSNTPAAPAPVVVQGGAGGATAGGGEETGGEAGGGTGGESLGTAGGGGSKGKEKGSGEPTTDKEAVTASEDQLEELESETGEEAAKNALKLPDKIATPGAPPPIDKSKPPGGGEGGGVVIK